MSKNTGRILAATLLAIAAAALQAQGLLKPYTLASNTTADYAKTLAAAQAKIQGVGFEIVGSYNPVPEATVLVITSDELRKAAASSDFGGYLAVMRVAVTRQWGAGKGLAFDPNGTAVQVSYTNPEYWAAAYRVKADLSGVKAKLVSALGSLREFGSFGPLEKGIAAKDLEKYHYTVMMEYFDNPSDLGTFASHDEALKAVEAGLAARRGGVSKVARVDIPGKPESVFAVALGEGDAADQRIMKLVDKGPLHEACYGPYEILVSGVRVYALYARFRIAIAYLGLPMMASSTSGTFLDIMSAPGAIEGALKKVVRKD